MLDTANNIMSGLLYDEMTWISVLVDDAVLCDLLSPILVTPTSVEDWTKSSCQGDRHHDAIGLGRLASGEDMPKHHT